MKLGVTFPQTEIGTDPGAIREFAQVVEGLGFNHLLVYDHVLGADTSHYKDWSGTYDKDDMFHEPFVLYGYLAAVTSSIELCTGIIILPQRQTALVAKQAAEVDVLSGGRLRLGIGVGIKPEEFEALEIAYPRRGRRCEEQMALLRALWTNEVVDYEGEWHRVRHGGINPLPVQRPIPIWIGGHSPPVLDRIARSADGWMPNFEPDEEGAAIVARLHTRARAHGRDPAEIGFEATVNVLGRTPEQWREDALAWRALGATHLSANTMQEEWDEAAGMWSKAKGERIERADAHLEVLERYIDVVGDL